MFCDVLEIVVKLLSSTPRKCPKKPSLYRDKKGISVVLNLAMTMHIAQCIMVHFFAITALLLIYEFPAGNFMEYMLQCDFWNRGTWKKIIQPQHFRIIIIIIIIIMIK